MLKKILVLILSTCLITCIVLFFSTSTEKNPKFIKTSIELGTIQYEKLDNKEINSIRNDLYRSNEALQNELDKVDNEYYKRNSSK